MQESNWYYMDRGGQRQGPVAASSVVDAYRVGELLPDGLAWREGLPQWLPLAQIASELGLDLSGSIEIPPPIPTMFVNQSAGIDHTDIVYAGFMRRWAALLLDNLILAVPLFIVVVVLATVFGLIRHGAGDQAAGMVQAVYYLLWLVAAPLYYAGQESSQHQATLGKRALGIKVTDDTGRRLTFSHALGRWFAAALSYLTCYVGFLMAAFTERKRALHDMVASTLVVDRWAYSEHPERQQRGTHGCLVACMIGFFVAIPAIAILAAISISQYQDYVIRSQVSEGAALADGVKTAVAEYVRNTGKLPSGNGEAGLAQSSSIHGRYVGDVSVVDGNILVTYSSNSPQHANTKLDGRTLEFRPNVSNDVIEWHCSSSNIPQKWCSARCECQ